VVLQTKNERLGMYLMGQAFFSAQLMQRFRPRSVESVALVAQDDDVLRPLFEQYAGMRVVVYPLEACNPGREALQPPHMGHCDSHFTMELPTCRPASRALLD
jgi:hypothetical protein